MERKSSYAPMDLWKLVFFYRYNRKIKKIEFKQEIASSPR